MVGVEHALTDDTKAILLLCGDFGNQSSCKPLSLSEYNRLVQWLRGKTLRPADFLHTTLVDDAAAGTGFAAARLRTLLGRGFELGCVIEEWQRKGIWICSRSDSAYPALYRKRLADKTPPILYGCGERSLLVGGGLAVVGSRNVDAIGKDFTRRAATVAAESGIPVISGGARGVDVEAMDAALAAGGCVIGVLADSLLKRSVERTFRQALTEKRLLLLSAQPPLSRFFVGNAMARNKLIYALADYALVVSAEENTGGTWAGAQECLQQLPAVPVFVRGGACVPAGNAALLQQGGLLWPDIGATENLGEVLNSRIGGQQCRSLAPPSSPKHGFARAEALSLFSVDGTAPESATGTLASVQESSLTDGNAACVPPVTPVLEDTTTRHESPAQSQMTSAYDAVLPLVLKACTLPQHAADVALSLDVTKTQLDKWLQRAVQEGKIRRIGRPLRYVAV